MTDIIVKGDDDFISYRVGDNPPTFKITPNERFLERLAVIDREISYLQDQVRRLNSTIYPDEEL